MTRQDRFQKQKRIHRESVSFRFSMGTIVFINSIVHLYSYMRYKL